MKVKVNKKFFEREFGNIGLWYDKLDKHKIFSIGFLFVILISYFGLFFDLSVTNINYNKNKSEFLEMEANQLLVNELKNNGNIFTTFSVIGEFLKVTAIIFLYVAIFLATSKSKLKLKDKVIRFYSSLAISLSLVGIGIMKPTPFMGGSISHRRIDND